MCINQLIIDQIVFSLYLNYYETMASLFLSGLYHKPIRCNIYINIILYKSKKKKER